MSKYNPVSFSLSFKGRLEGTLDNLLILLSAYKGGDYYAYEREESWHVGVGSRASLILNPIGDNVTIFTAEKKQSLDVTSNFTEIARQFISDYSKPGSKVFGQVGFNYAARIRGLDFRPGCWPLVSLMVPETEILLQDNIIKISSGDDNMAKEMYEMLSNSLATDIHSKPLQIDINENRQVYMDTVSHAVSAIHEGQFSKVIASRAVGVPRRVDMASTLIQGRQSNTPRRSFSLNHSGFQATGFSPELVFLVEDGKVITEPLAGTKRIQETGVQHTSLTNELQNDPKEVFEHAVSVREAISELRQICSPGTVVVEDFMSVRARGSVQHLGSRVAGRLLPEKDGWDALGVMFPSITASGIPKTAAMAFIAQYESRPRELYSGAVMMLENPDFFETTLVLRTVFQDQYRSWIQAGAGIISMSTPQREFTETCEKLESIAPHIIADTET
ncbi:putative salicylate synthetase [Nemania abortiva]|nr:putative salicylate synthetase [Nemania abortiva]